MHCNKSPGCSLWKALLYETGQNSKTHTYNPDVGSNFLCLTWFYHIIRDSGESRGQAVGLYSYISIWSPSLSSCIIIIGSIDQPKLQNMFFRHQECNRIRIFQVDSNTLACKTASLASTTHLCGYLVLFFVQRRSKNK